MRNRLPSAQCARRCAAVLASLALWSGCAAIEHATSTDAAAGVTLATATPVGSERLALEGRYDAAVREALKTHGTPEYLHVVDRDHLYLFYPGADRVAVVSRNGLPPGEVLILDRIPGHFFRLLPGPAVETIQAARSAKTSGRASLRRAPRVAPAPAAIAPDSGLRLTGFDTAALVARFREPLSAADPGVSGWREAALADGSRAAVAHAAGTEFLVGRESVSASVPIRPQSRTTPAAVRTGYTRVNRAVFGTRASAVSRRVATLVDAVAADPSGRTRSVSRIAGRRVSIVRDIGRDTFVYTVAAD